MDEFEVYGKPKANNQNSSHHHYNQHNINSYGHNSQRNSYQNPYNHNLYNHNSHNHNSYNHNSHNQTNTRHGYNKYNLPEDTLVPSYNNLNFERQHNNNPYAVLIPTSPKKEESNHEIKKEITSISIGNMINKGNTSEKKPSDIDNNKNDIMGDSVNESINDNTHGNMDDDINADVNNDAIGNENDDMNDDMGGDMNDDINGDDNTDGDKSDYEKSANIDNFPVLSYMDVQINLRLIGDVKEGEKLMIDGANIKIDQRYMQSFRRYWSSDSRAKALRFINHTIDAAKLYCNEAVEKIKNKEDVKVNMEKLIHIQGLLKGCMNGLSRIANTYYDDKHNLATIETFKSTIAVFCDQDLKNAIYLS